MEELTMRDYLKVLFRQKGVIITTFITVMATVTIGLKLKTPIYEAQVKMLISAEKQVESPYYRELVGYQNIQATLTQSEIVKSNPVIERAVRALGLYERPLDYEKRFCSDLKKTLIDFQMKNFNKKLAHLTKEQKRALLFRLAVEDLRKNIKVEPIRDTNLFTITARDFSPIGAAVIANVVSRSYVIFDLEQQLADLQLKYGEKHLSVMQMKDTIKKMIKTLNGEPLPNIKAIGPASVKIVEQAQIPLKPSGQSKWLILLLAFFMSIFLGIMLAFVFEYLDQTFKSPQDIEKFLNIPFLGSIPKKKKLKKESLHNLSAQLYLLMKDKNLKSLLLTSALPKEGVTTITANIARHLSEKAGHKVLLIDANLRNPSIHKAFNISDSPGLAEVLEGKTSFEQAIKSMDIHELHMKKHKSIRPSSSIHHPSEPETANTSLHILPAGKTELNPITLLDSSQMAKIIEEAKKRYKLIFVDCTNLKNFKDSLIISSYLDGICLVIKEGKTRRQVVKSAIAPLEQKKANIIGVILNNRTFTIPKLIYDRV